MFAVYRISWVESERGWGISPDGYSLHATEVEANKYIKDYWDGMPDRSAGVPDVYERPGEPQLFEVTQEIHDFIEEVRNVRYHSGESLKRQMDNHYKRKDCSHENRQLKGEEVFCADCDKAIAKLVYYE